MTTHPTQLKLDDDHYLLIEWSDGRTRRYSPLELRDKCPCATCREKRRGAAEQPPASLQLNILSPAEAQPTRVVAMRPVGSYAYTIVFNDGHDSGIFPFELLRELGRKFDE